MTRLSGKTAIVTAAAQGIGRAAAELFVREGARVLALDINADALATLEGCEAHAVDLMDGQAIKDFAEQVGAVDVLFNCAGFVHAGTILTTEEVDWDFSFDLNVRSQYRLIRALLPAMIANGGGSIVNMSSVASHVIAVPNRFVYTASKAAVIGLTKSVALDFVGSGIRCNAICPGTVQSPSLEERMAATGDAEAARAAFTARQPMGRLGRAEEIAELALYLASDASSYTTGAVHVIDGGWSNA
ncbi:MULTISPECIES: SDR family oxidoreductase [Sphingomonas]|jgi:2-keto-3-deoxy-L-fuconate dehydrogenase|uniref:NAD(P)-dependent oxidoreductase n=1 Tax=Sphingomonas hankookensis TaxID=563996 RepID=A0ABR5YEI1_9SPHN|nr:MULTISPECIES: SDR family oxidoreductase [Sphingomonas]KZE17756.1 NAD(P)-dependent oxidoreductase [Sphingomonas hankookensis]PZT95879.1 MAG: NAD(P)-dependent oxidoreductase [Sphingomonas sp.]WCP72823.1 SDR family oxidoreductase [Sphingomonas hankookensis]